MEVEVIHESDARKHYMNIRAEREEPRRPMGFQPPKNGLHFMKLYQQPYGVPGPYITDEED